MLFTLEKLQARSRQVGERRYINMTAITPLRLADAIDPGDAPIIDVPASVDGSRLTIGDVFSGRDRYLWAEKVVRLPQHRDGCQVVGLFDFGLTGAGSSSGFEALLYVDGKPYQGVDTNHQDVVLESLAGEEVRLTFLLWTGLEGGGPPKNMSHLVRSAHVGYLHGAADEFYHLSSAITATVGLLPDTSVAAHDLTAALDAACLLIDWDDDVFHATIAGALRFLTKVVGEMDARSPVVVDVVGHTHIDLAWLWRLRHTREKAIRSFSTVLRLMDEFDDYTFVQSQPQLYQFVKQDCPALYERVRARVAEGRWEPDGGMWVEADCNLASGEALARQITNGVWFFREEFGTDCEYLWLPDVFGYSWALPQLLKLANITTFMTTKISWNQYNTMPHDLFWWRGIDGSEILTYFITTPEPGEPAGLHRVTYNGQLTPETVLGAWDRFRDKDLSHDVLISFGFGDGGGGATRDMLKAIRVMDGLPGLPRVRPMRAGEFFRNLHRQVDESKRYVHTWDGELYLELHRGTYTSQAANKAANRRLEFALTQCEWLCASAGLDTYPKDQLRAAWQCVLLHQFHDILPGSAIREVNEDAKHAYAKVQESVEAMQAKSLAALTMPARNSFVVSNSASFPRRELALLPVTEDGTFHDADGVLSAQRTNSGWVVAVEVDALAMRTVQFTPGVAAKAKSAFTVDMEASTVVAPHHTIVWDRGQLVSIVDARDNSEIMAGPGNLLEVFEDKPLNFDNWDIDIFHFQKREPVLAVSATLVEDGPERCIVRFGYVYRHSVIEQDMIVYARSARIDFCTSVQWHETDRLLKVAFPVNVRSTTALYDIQFGHVARPTNWNTSWDWARFEVVGHKWADISQADLGVSLLNDCKYGYSVRGNVMRLTLLKSTKFPDTEMDMGSHKFTYSLFPHAGSAITGGTIEEAVALNQPCLVTNGKLRSEDFRILRVESVDGQVIVDAVKKAENEGCLVVRFHECLGGRANVRVSSDMGLRAFALSNLLEDDLSAVTEGDSIHTTLQPFEIQTWKLWLSGSARLT